jgi:hypothetical protein
MLLMKLKYEGVLITVEFLIVLTFFALIYTSYEIEKNDIRGNIYFIDLLNNWSLFPIKELYIAEKCERYLLLRTWEGVEANCDCRVGGGTIDQGECSIADILTGCINTQAHDPSELTKWKGGQSICITEHKYGLYDVKSTIDICPEGYKVCGKDTKGFNLCFKDEDDCPINKIEFSNKPRDGFRSIKLSNNWYISTSNNFTNETIPIDFKYSEGRVCLNPSEDNLKQNYNSFKKVNETINLTTTVKSKYYERNHTHCRTKLDNRYNFDERYVQLDTTSKFMFFSYNGIIGKIQPLPFINTRDLMGYSSIINFRSYIYWSPYCIEQNSQFSFINKVMSLESINQVFYVLNVLLRLEFLFYLSTPLLEKILKNIKCNLLLASISSLLIVNTIVQIIFYQFSYIADGLITQKCGDYVTNTVLEDIGKRFYDIMVDSYKITLCLVILISLLIIKKILKLY